MATANVLELETCLKDSIAYCEEHQQHEFVQFHEPRLKRARSKWVESVEVSDARYLEWQTEVREDRVAWRKLAGELKATRTELRKFNAIGYPDTAVQHWDEEILTAAVEEMIAYLETRTDVLEIASDRIEALSRALDSAQGEGSEADDALEEFKRHVLFRAEAMGTLNATLADFRISMRRVLGKKSEEYRSIRWPITLAPDENVL